MVYPWGDDRRFNSYAGYFKRTFGERVQKVAINAGFTCPNRDGKVGNGGCSYCNNDAFNPAYCIPQKSITRQLAEGIEFHQRRYRRAKNYLAYFQAFSNTYASLDILKKKYSEALSFPGVIGLVIGTRPDCVSDEILEYIAELSKEHYIIVEYGIESCYNRTLKRINRGHTFEETKDAITKTADYGIKTGAHLIFGLPGESIEDMLNEASIISELPLNNVKFHQLQIFKHTKIAEDYHMSTYDFTLFTMEEYFDFFIEFLEHLNPDFVVERFTGEVPPRYLEVPAWGLKRNDQVLAMFEKELEKRDTWQGKLFKGIV